MCNLFIIGNGFDRDHNLPTSYNDFREFLRELTQEGFKEDSLVEIPESFMLPDGGLDYDQEAIINVFVHLIDNVEGTEWNEVEKSLGELEFTPILDYNSYNAYNYNQSDNDEDDYDIDEHDLRAEYEKNEENANTIKTALTLFTTSYIKNWIEKIDVTASIKKDFNSIIDKENDFFLCFNYTNTLEKNYGIQNVCHIHGKVEDDELLFGHGNNANFDSDYFETHFFGSESILRTTHDELRKNTFQALNNCQSFFSLILSSIKKGELRNIYSYGFSFSEVDLFYLQSIFNNVDTSNITLYLNDYNYEKDGQKYENAIRTCGFNGEIKTFSIKN